MRINIGKITGFQSGDERILISTPDGKPFYLKYTKGVKTRFNLPPGEYVTENNLMRLENPVQYRLPKLPRKNFNPETLPVPVVTFGENPNKCSVHIPTGKIFMDNSFKKFPAFVLRFIFYHEAGHFYYRGDAMRSEKNCDLFATREMLKRGFNPSQIHLAQKITLENIERKKHIFEHLKKSAK